MLMIDLEPDECLYLPTPDGREVRVEAPHAVAGPQSVAITIPGPQATTVTVPGLKENDRVDLLVGGCRLTVRGGKRKSHKTRLALDLPDDCRVRYSRRIRKPRKQKQGA